MHYAICIDGDNLLFVYKNNTLVKLHCRKCKVPKLHNTKIYERNIF